MKTKVSARIACNANHLWSFLVEESKIKLWLTGLIYFSPTDGKEIKEGSVIHLKIKEGKLVSDYLASIVKYNYSRELSLRLKSKHSSPKSITVIINYALSVESEYVTRIDFLALAPSSELRLLTRFFLPLFKLFSKARAIKLIKRLKKISEATSS